MTATARTIVRPRSYSQRIVDAIALALVAYAAMNLNGVVEMYAGEAAALSPLVLAGSTIILFACFARERVGPAYRWLVGFIALYFIGGIVPLVTRGAMDTAHMTQYIGTLIYCSAIYFYLANRGDAALPKLFAVLQVMFMIDCVAALNSPLLEYFEYARETERATGFFENPNETAVMALYYLIIAVMVPSRWKLWRLVQIALAVATVVMTFSKTGLLLLCVLAAGHMISRRAYGMLMLSAIAVVLLLPVLDYVATVNVFGLGIDQRRRIEQIVSIFSGQVDDKVTTGRTTLWALGLERISATFPFGGGLGTFHNMEGGYVGTEGQWLGVHNAFLMVLGESGLAALLALCAFLSALFRSIRTSPRALMCYAMLVVLIGDMLVTHGALIIRVHDLMLALVLAIGFAANRVEAPITPKRAARHPLLRLNRADPAE